MRRLRPSLTYANVMSSIAVFLALGGGAAYASHLVVRSTDIVNDQVQSSDVRDDTLSGGGLLSRDIRANALTGADVTALTGGDVNDNSLTGNDVRELRGADVVDGSLGGRDIAKRTTRVTKDFGTVGAQGCHTISAGVPASNNDHVVLTPDYDSTSFFVEYTAQVQSSSGVVISACNPTTSSRYEGNATFNVLVIDGA